MKRKWQKWEEEDAAVFLRERIEHLDAVNWDKHQLERELDSLNREYPVEPTTGERRSKYDEEPGHCWLYWYEWVEKAYMARRDQEK
ncbi:hypothetical protein H1S01_16755 [Heliobacterium chlorum]|uniref:Uncharacterized protein n=1 Tax=Heliobacterium chlorum TaxID=2698 RepID=A0ABR7T6V4_HELCL|nr:hypothetical protein [Heliobacterium chlorum]MBC9786120.1 hypothetical protein [Heliobacterium chlorum]